MGGSRESSAYHVIQSAWLHGHYYSGMLKFILISRRPPQFGGHIELLEVEELVVYVIIRCCRNVQPVKLFDEKFDVQPQCSGEELENAAKTSVALDKLVQP